MVSYLDIWGKCDVSLGGRRLVEKVELGGVEWWTDCNGISES